MEWMFLPYKRYFDFSGRSRRKEYWLFALLMFVVYIVCDAILMTARYSLGGGAEMGGFALVMLLLVFVLASFIPALAVQVRRFHDQDKSGWFVLLNLIPFFGGLVVLVMMCLEGTRGPNRYGPDPLGTDAEVFA